LGTALQRRLRSDNGNIIIKMHDEQLGLARHRDRSISGSVARCDLETAATHAAAGSAVTFVGATRTVTIPLEVPDFERLERLATKHNVGTATLGRQIIREYLKRKAKKD
jgi:hypothetical protein